MTKTLSHPLSRAARLAAAQCDLTDAADLADTLRTEFENAGSATIPDEAGALAVFGALTESVAELNARTQRGREIVESLAEEIGAWRDNIEAYFAATPLYERLQECEATLAAIVESLDPLPEIALPSDDELAGAADDGELRGKVLTRLMAECEALSEILRSSAEEMDQVEFPTARG